MVKKIRKPLALFLALVMCLGMVNFTALANETADHEHNADGWTCTQAEPVKTLNCEEDHEHGDECYTVTEGEWTCVAPVVEETPAEVTAFLSAVAGIPAITAENAAEVAEYVYGPVSEAYEALLGTEYEERADVQEAVAAYAAAIDAVDAALDMESENYLAQISGKTPTDRFYYNGVEVAQLYEGTYPLSTTYQYSNPATGIEIFVGDPGNYQYLYTKMSTCHCGTVLVKETPDWITVDSNRKLTDSNPGIIQGKPTWNLSGYVAEDWTDYGYEGYPSLQINVVGAKPGNTSIRFQAYQAYDYLYTWQTCNYCGQIYSKVGFNGWIEDTQTLNVMVKARYQLNYDLNGGTGSIASTYDDVADTTATLYVTGEKPADWTKDGKTYTFKGWSETSDGKTPAAGSYTLNWSTGLGGKNNPVQKTLYAIWEEKDEETTYTLIREYWIDGEKIAFVKDSTLKGQVGDEIVGAELAKANPNWANRKVDNVVHTFNYVGCDPTPSLTLTETVADNVITLKYEKNTKPQAPTKEEAAGILDGKYTVKVSCTNEARTHTLASKNYSITAADITSIGAVTKNASGKWEVEVTSTNQKFVDKFEAEANVNCAHDDVSGGFGIKLTWDGSKWTYNETTTKGINTACHPVQPTLYKLKYDANGGTIRSDGNAATTMTHEANSFDNSYTFTVKTAPEASTGFDPTWAGHTLLGWADTAEEANAGTVQYNAGDKIKLTKDAPTKTIYAVWQENPVAPDKPTHREVRDQFESAVTVICDTPNSGHGANSSFGYTNNDDQKSRVTIGEVQGDATNGYTCQVTFIAQKFCDAYNGTSNAGNAEHKLADGQGNVTLTFTWNATSKKWERPAAVTKVVIHVVCKPVPILALEVNKSNTGFKVDEDGNASVDYTVTVKNASDIDLYGLRLTDTMTVTPNDGTVTYTFKNWKVNGSAIEPISGNSTDLVHTLWLVARNMEFAKDATVTLTYTVDIVNTSDDEVAVKMENIADADSWDKEKVEQVSLFALRSRTAEDDDPPAVSGSSGSSAGGTSGSSTGGTLPGKKYTVTYSWNLPEGATGTLPAGGKYSKGAAVTVDTTYTDESTVTVNGETYTFSGWNKTDFTMPAENVTITGTWTPVITPPDPEYKVTVDPANGEDKTETTVKENGEFTVPAAPTAPEGKEFDGWKGSDGKDYKPGDKITVTGDLTLTAQWKDEVIPEPEKITVTWKSGYGENETLKTGEYDKGTATVPAADYPAAPSRSGYTFTGWSDPVADADGNLTITAQWTQNTRPVTPDPDYTYTLNYNANGGVGAPTAQSQTNNRNFTISAVEPTREGYTFAGWALTANAEEAAYQPGEQIRINTGFSLTLHAVWTPVEDVNETEPPLVETPDVTETPDEGEDLGDNDTPLTELPDETEPPVEPTETPDETEDLDEGDTPLAEVPQTGDSIGLWIVLTLCSAAGLYCFFPKKKKGQREI